MSRLIDKIVDVLHSERADAEVAGFCLTGSNRPADVGAAHGQASLI